MTTATASTRLIASGRLGRSNGAPTRGNQAPGLGMGLAMGDDTLDRTLPSGGHTGRIARGDGATSRY
jgi:hypothetical protein